MAQHSVSLSVNQRLYRLEVGAGETLLNVLRDRLELKGTKKGCGEGQCGACTVIKDGVTVNACLTLAVDCEGAEITTIEGLAPAPDTLHPLQETFIQHGAVQCGFCTPGMLMAAKSLLDRSPNPTREEIKRALSGNLCRCTGYKKIVDAVEAVARGIPGPAEPAIGPIGGDLARADAVEHVTGRSVFGADVVRQGMVVGRVLRSAHAHARILRLDTTEAERLPGVLAVVTGRETAPGYFGADIKDRRVFATDKVRYRGDAIAAVAAIDEATAERALDLIRVEYEPLEAVLDAREAMAPGAPIIHENLERYEIGFETQRYGNVCTVTRVQTGDLEAGFERSDVVLESTFQTQIQHQASLETHAAVAEIDPSGRVMVWSSTQKPFAMQRYLAQAFELPVSAIRVSATRIGGGFGGKLELIAEPYAVALALKCRRPVRVVYDRREEFLATTPRHQAWFHVKSGLTRDGTLLARQVQFIYDTGAYSGNGPTTVTLSAQLIGGLYRIPNLRIEGYCVYTNKMNFGSMRGPSAPQTTFAMESHMDDLAAAIGMDPVDLRLKNLLKPGEKTGVGQVLVDVDYKQVVRAAAEAAGWHTLGRDPNVGKGMACVFWLSGGWATSATVKINEDSSVTVITGAVDMGTGYLYTAVPQIVAEALGVRPDAVQVVTGDTDQAPYDHGIGGSRGTFTIGQAARMAALKVRDDLLQAAASHLEAPVEVLEIREGWINLRDRPQERVSFGALSLQRHTRQGGPIVATAAYLPQMDPIDEDRVQGLSFTAFKGNTIGCHVAVVRVSPDTGQVEILKYVAAHDVGKAINPRAVEGQIEGGTVMGLGFGLTEELLIGPQGEPLNADLHDYKLLTALDAPETLPVIVEVPCRHGPHGAKGLGEPTAAPPAAALANAIRDATGIRLTQTPLTPERIRRAMARSRSVRPATVDHSPADHHPRETGG